VSWLLLHACPTCAQCALPVFDRYPTSLNKAMRMIMIRLQVHVHAHVMLWLAGSDSEVLFGASALSVMSHQPAR
jgi:hypothetical protein